jgi:hypothetical protein
MAQCGANKRNGAPCTVSVPVEHEWCWWHSPVNAEARQQAASKGGRAKANPLTRTLHRQLEKLTEDVATGALAPYKAAVIVQALNTRIRLVEVERRVAEQEELLERLDALERARGGGGGRWGA